MGLRIQRALGIALLVLSFVLVTIIILRDYVVPRTADFEWFHKIQFVRGVGLFECLLVLAVGSWLVVRVSRNLARSAESA